MKILLLGKDGQVGRELQRSLSPLGDVVAYGRAGADLENLDALRILLERESPQWIVNAAAYTAVDRAEEEPERARRINEEAVRVMAEAAKLGEATLIHYSTDYVFDGEKSGAYTEKDAPRPQSIYGLTKHAGEEAIRASGCRHLIFRTSWVYSTHGGNFTKTMLRLAASRDALQVVADQVGAPTGADMIADVTARCLYRMSLDREFAAFASGTYHLAAAGETSWHGYARFIIETALRHGAKLRAVPERILPITTADYPLPAKRPANSRLDTGKLRSSFGLSLPPWQQHASRTIAALVPAMETSE